MPFEDIDTGPPLTPEPAALDHNQAPPAAETQPEAALEPETPATEQVDAAAPAETDAEEVPMTDEEHAAAEAKRKKTGSQRLKERNARLEAELEFYKAQLYTAAPPQDAPQPPPHAIQPQVQTPTVPGKPDLNQFDSYEAYQEALTDWKVEQKLAERAQMEAMQRRQAEIEQVKTQYLAKVEQTKAAHADFDDVVTPMLVHAVDRLGLGEAIATSEVGPQVLYHLGKNPEDLKRIAGLNPLAAARELGRLESRLVQSTPKPTTSQTPTKPTAPAAAPLAPVRGGATANRSAYSGYSDF